MERIHRPISWAECWELVHEIARRQLGRERDNHTLGATDVANEVFLRCHADPPDWRGEASARSYFSTIVRHVFVDYSRRRGATKRGGDRTRVDLDPDLFWKHEDPAHVLVVDEWVQRLRQHDRQLASMVEMKVFGGMSSEEIGEFFGVGRRQVDRRLADACAWLERDMRRAEGG